MANEPSILYRMGENGIVEFFYEGDTVTLTGEIFYLLKLPEWSDKKEITLLYHWYDVLVQGLKGSAFREDLGKWLAQSIEGDIVKASHITPEGKIDCTVILDDMVLPTWVSFLPQNAAMFLCPEEVERADFINSPFYMDPIPSLLLPIHQDQHSDEHITSLLEVLTCRVMRNAVWQRLYQR